MTSGKRIQATNMVSACRVEDRGRAGPSPRARSADRLDCPRRGESARPGRRGVVDLDLEVRAGIGEVDALRSPVAPDSQTAPCGSGGGVAGLPGLAVQQGVRRRLRGG